MSKHYTVISPAHKDGMPEWRIIDDQGNIVAVAYAEDIAIKIAAAPDLLEALKLSYAWMRGELGETFGAEDLTDRDICNMAAKAITKAVGQ